MISIRQFVIAALVYFFVVSFCQALADTIVTKGLPFYAPRRVSKTALNLAAMIAFAVYVWPVMKRAFSGE